MKCAEKMIELGGIVLNPESEAAVLDFSVNNCFFVQSHFKKIQLGCKFIRISKGS